ncbi:hypothetical protein [Scytonema sp. UIC 10036]|uniref:hypothetical protein n=1 Tax=Scytonema sp. UIC 10036 TaxID=2304196 RepID=UPI001FA9C60D|nr:hypothetical protein [Scytonema sp. UIC 10036]
MYDHRVLAKNMDLFHFEEHSPGMVFWHPMGLRLFRIIEDYMRQVYQSRGFEEVRSRSASCTQLIAFSIEPFALGKIRSLGKIWQQYVFCRQY